MQVAQKAGLRLFEMFALRDLYVLLSVPSVFQKVVNKEKAAEGLRRLRWVLRAFLATPDEISRLLGPGLDADEILRQVVQQ